MLSQMLTSCTRLSEVLHVKCLLTIVGLLVKRQPNATAPVLSMFYSAISIVFPELSLFTKENLVRSMRFHHDQEQSS